MPITEHCVYILQHGKINYRNKKETLLKRSLPILRFSRKG